MKGSVEVKAELECSSDDGQWGVTLTMPRSMAHSVLRAWHTKSLYVVSSGGPVDESTSRIVIGPVPEPKEEDLREGACNADYVFSDTQGDIRCRCSKNRGHVGEHGALFGPCTLCDNGKNVRQPFGTPCPDCGRHWEARCGAETTGRLGVHDHVGMALVCRKVKNHAGAHEWEPVEPVSSETVAEKKQTYTRDMFRDRVNDIAIPSDDGRRRVVERLKEAYWEGHFEGVRATKAEHGSAIEESDKTRAFRVAESLFGDRLISGDRQTVEVRFADALAEVRSIATLQGGIGALTEVHGTVFFAELEKHRALIHAIGEQDVCNPEVRALARAVWFLLAVAHQP